MLDVEECHRAVVAARSGQQASEHRFPLVRRHYSVLQLEADTQAAADAGDDGHREIRQVLHATAGGSSRQFRRELRPGAQLA